jgi:hypothetical protein
MNDARIRQCFDELVRLLEKHSEPSLARAASLAAAENRLDEFLTSNDLWGGSGSIADQAGMPDGKRTDKTREIEHALIQLGKEQVRLGLVNPRTASWIATFAEWRRKGI